MGSRKFIPLLILLLSGLSMFGQQSVDSAKINTVLFRISNKDSGRSSYLFGTHHAFGKEFFDSIVKANQALGSSDLLIKENLNLPGRMAEDIINQRTEITNWKKYLDKNDLAFVENLFATSPTDFRKMTPTELYVFLNRHFKQEICLNKNPTDTSLSLDDYISSIAVKKNIEVLGLETTEEQIHIINKDVEAMPRRNHKRRLANIIEKLRSRNANSCEETSWYARMEMDYQFDEPCRNRLVLTDRNAKWMETIQEKLQSNSCFIAVGLSHLMYDCGLIVQLEELGYIITSVELK
ncbi:TraB/GumN family protein [Gramella sp. BOM4]|nr:TraB/GumN family protein [Christiangramia bathymodioli]